VAKLARMSLKAVMNRQLHAPARARSHVLAVDDDPVMREAISDYLGQYDFRVTAVADGHAMQAVLARDVVDLVVLDLKLRDEDGMVLASWLREESAIPIIMLTAWREVRWDERTPAAPI
jgi:two-component system OmpR family response regulator